MSMTVAVLMYTRTTTIMEITEVKVGGRQE